MKSKFALSTLIAALSGFAGLANSAHAGPDLSIRINLGAPPHPVVVAPVRPIVVAPGFGFGPGGHDFPDRGSDFRDNRAPRGYWKEIVVAEWVPARWVVSRDNRGRTVRTFERGYYKQRTDRVWVEFDGNNGRRDHY